MSQINFGIIVSMYIYYYIKCWNLIYYNKANIKPHRQLQNVGVLKLLPAENHYKKTAGAGAAGVV